MQQQLGHPDAVAALNVRMRALAAKGGDQALAGYFEQHEQFSEAAAIYKSVAERAATPQEAVSALQSLARIYQREERVDDAVAAQKQAIARIEAAGTPEMNGQSTATATPERAIPVRKRIVQLADLVYPAKDPQRGQVRTEAAMALANQGQFDEAERLATEAVSFGAVSGQAAKGHANNSFDYALRQIRRMRAMATAASNPSRDR